MNALAANECWTVSRRLLGPLESMQRDAIVQSLLDYHGSKVKTVGRSWRARGSRETVGAAPRGPGAVVGVRAPRRAGLGAVCGVRVAAPRPCGCASVLPASPRPAAACP